MEIVQVLCGIFFFLFFIFGIPVLYVKLHEALIGCLLLVVRIFVNNIFGCFMKGK